MKNLLPALVLLFCCSCNKDIDELPEATQTGANTFGAKLNDAFWIPRSFSPVGSATILEAWYSGSGKLLINARDLKSSPTETEFELYVHNITGPGTYTLNQATDRYPYATSHYGYYIKRKFMPEHEWMTNDAYTGSINITRFDTVGLVVSGTFAFNAVTSDSSAAPITVSEGRFDIKLNQ